MGALATAWQVRAPASVQLDLTQQGVEGATTVATALLTAAETDASNQFFHKTGLAFDSTNSEHITVGCIGVTYFLHSYKMQPRSSVTEAAREDWTRACTEFAKTRGALMPVTPATNSNLNPSQDESGALPRFDRRVLSDMIPRPPNTGATDTLLDFDRGAGA